MTGAADEVEFSAEERGETVPRPLRVLLLVGVLVALFGAAGAVVWGNAALDGPVPTATVPSSGQDRPGAADADTQVAALQAEDARLRAVAAGTPSAATVVLAPRPAAYGVADLVASGAVVADGTTLTLTRSVVVLRGARLDLAAPGATLRMRSGADGFTSIVAWGGTLRLAGSEAAPLTVVGWDAEADAPDETTGDGRAYVRVKDGRLDVAHVDAHHLGFWSGRTGGIAATGSGEALTSAGVVDLQVSDVHIGLHLSGVSGVVVDQSSFTRTQESGVEISQSDNVVLRGVDVADTGRNGVEIARGTSSVQIADVSVRETGGYGVFADGAALADGPNSAGWGTRDYSGLHVDQLDVRDAARGGVRVDSTTDVLLTRLDVADSGIALDLRGAAAGASVAASQLVAGAQPALRVTEATGVTLDDVSATADTTAVLAERGAAVAVTDSRLQVDEGQAALAQGDDTTLSVDGGAVVGRGAGAVAARNGATASDSGIDSDEWSYRPALLTWALADVHLLLLLLLIPIPVVGLLFVRRRRRDHGTLRRHFQEEATRLGQERLAQYDAVVAARAGAVSGVSPTAASPTASAVVEVPDSPAELEELEALGSMDQPTEPVGPVPPVRAPEVAPPAPVVSTADSMRALAVAAVVEQGYRPSDVARSLGVPTSRVRGWVADRAG